MTQDNVAYYYVDEAGDLTLFDRLGKCLVGTEGVSHCFMVGMAHIANPEGFRDELNGLRAEALADPYLREVPSMHPERKGPRGASTPRTTVRKSVREFFASSLHGTSRFRWLYGASGHLSKRPVEPTVRDGHGGRTRSMTGW